MPSFAHVINLMIAWTWVHAISVVLTKFNARRASTSPAKGKTVWEHSSTRKKYRDTARLNRGGAQLSINCVTAPPLLPVGFPYANHHTPRGAPHGRPRGPVRVASCHGQHHLRLARATRALPRGLSAALHLKVVPRATSAPARHVSTRS